MTEQPNVFFLGPLGPGPAGKRWNSETKKPKGGIIGEAAPMGPARLEE